MLHAKIENEHDLVFSLRAHSLEDSNIKQQKEKFFLMYKTRSSEEETVNFDMGDWRKINGRGGT